MSSISHAVATVAKAIHTIPSKPLMSPAALGLQLRTSKAASRVLVTGATGRLGQSFIPVLTGRNMSCISTSRSKPKSPDQVQMTFGESVEDFQQIFEHHKIDAVVNAAAASSGQLHDMLPVNTEAPLRMAEAARRAGIPFIQVSTTATQIAGVTQDNPYAYSKQLTERGLQENAYARTARLDVLLGDDSKIDLSLLAGIGKFSPVSLQISGIDSTIQPTTYDAASKALASFVESILAGKEHSKEINIAGHPIKMSEFIRMVGKTSYELHVPIEALNRIAQLVNEGSLTPEFLKLAIKSSQSPLIFDTSEFEALHGSPIPSVDEMAIKADETATLNSLYNAAKRVMSKASMRSLIAETLAILTQANLRKIPEHKTDLC